MILILRKYGGSKNSSIPATGDHPRGFAQARQATRLAVLGGNADQGDEVKEQPIFRTSGTRLSMFGSGQIRHSRHLT